MMLTLAQAQALVPGATLVGDGAVAFARVHSDTRTLQPGDLFVALRGEQFDAHDFLDQARDNGASAALAERGLAEAGLPGLQVPDALVALQQLAAAWRRRFTLPLIAVTGSNGKTTVTQMIASILRAADGEAAFATQGNLNNHIGLPLTLLRLRAQHRRAVPGVVVLAQPQQRQRHADVVVEVAGGGQHALAVPRSQDGGDHLRHRRLAVAAGDGDQRQVQARAPGRRQLLQGRQRVADAQTGQRRRAQPRLRQRGHGAGGLRLGEKGVAVETLATQRHEQVAGAQRAGVAVHALEADRTVADEQAAGQQGVGLRERHHPAIPPSRRCSADPASARSENGRRTPAISW